ncbi:MAG: hypothetical protein JO042_14100 [Sinobacteraceae bacterium]|nr:hypothetical protein [Nevskiaceae bacterium]
MQFEDTVRRARAVALTPGLLLAALLSSSCAHTDRVELENPQTGRVVECGPYADFALRATANVMQLNQCIQDFEKQGFVRR